MTPTCKQENGEISFLLDGTTPIPGTRQPSVDATAGIIEVVRPRTVKPVPEEVGEDFFDKTVDGTELLFDKPMNGWVTLEIGDLTEGGGDWKEDAVNLRILVDEYQSVRNVMVTFWG
jgi:hypothetical protein